MTLEFLELMEDSKKQEKEVQGTSSPRRKLQRSFKSNTRIYDDGSIEVDPQAQGEPSQKDVKKGDLGMFSSVQKEVDYSIDNDKEEN